jgi:hypothetical protein
LRRNIDEFILLDETNLPDIPREDALRLFLGQQLMPLLKRNQISRYLRVLNWEIMHRTQVFEELLASERIPTLIAAQGLVRKFLPDAATREEKTIATIWLLNQAYIFVRNTEHLSWPPNNLVVDEPFMERLLDMLAQLLTHALAGLARRQAGITPPERASRPAGGA